jgi:hypothetical protein
MVLAAENAVDYLFNKGGFTVARGRFLLAQACLPFSLSVAEKEVRSFGKWGITVSPQ